MAGTKNSMRLYRIWKGFRQRCRRPSGGNKVWYKGITSCPEWEDFDVFRKWAEETGYSDDLTIDRIDNSRGYSPDNCRWITIAAQQRNRRTNHPVTVDGRTFSTLTEAAEAYGVPRSYVSARIFACGWDVERALKTPPKKTSRRRLVI